MEEQALATQDELVLQAIAGPCEGDAYRGTGNATTLTVGRTRASKIHIKDRAISEKHAEISWNGSAWFLRDVGSSNGTKLNGGHVEGTNIRLKDGDIIQFGTDSKLSVKVLKYISDALTVEDYLQYECQRMIDQVQVLAEQSSNELHDLWRKEKRQLINIMM
eukprot:jgi/Botrbrau1/8633/Bobra.0196s0027.1